MIMNFKQIVFECIKELTLREQKVIKLRYGIDDSVVDIKRCWHDPESINSIPKIIFLLKKIFSVRVRNQYTRTLGSLAIEFDVTIERIRQIEAKALRKLRHPSRSDRLQEFIKYDKDYLDEHGVEDELFH